MGLFLYIQVIIIPLGNKKQFRIMNSMKVSGETPFSVLAHSFSVGHSSSGYTLLYSAGDNNFTAWTAATPSNETLIVNGIAKGMIFKLSGNTDEVLIKY
jgi:membrane-associated PAP2 superfamily phosphatase